MTTLLLYLPGCLLTIGSESQVTVFMISARLLKSRCLDPGGRGNIRVLCNALCVISRTSVYTIFVVDIVVVLVRSIVAARPLQGVPEKMP